MNTAAVFDICSLRFKRRFTKTGAHLGMTKPANKKANICQLIKAH